MNFPMGIFSVPILVIVDYIIYALHHWFKVMLHTGKLSDPYLFTFSLMIEHKKLFHGKFNDCIGRVGIFCRGQMILVEI